MAYSSGRLGLSLTVSMVATIVLVFLILSSQISMALAPVLGVGGIYLQADALGGNDGKVFPVHGGAEDGNSPYTSTPDCSNRPMLAFQLNSAVMDGFEMRKDLQIPFLNNRWLSLTIDEPNGVLQGQQLTAYITQLDADYLQFRNIELYEGGPFDSTDPPNFGPYSGEFIIEGGGGTPSDVYGIVAYDAQLWLHALTGQQVAFISDDFGTIQIDMEYVTDSELDSYYDNRLGYNLPEFPNAENPEYRGQIVDRDQYFDCLP